MTDRTEPLHVLHLIKGLGRGGAEILLLEGLRHGDRNTFRYTFGYFLPHKDALVEPLRREGAEVVRFHARTELGMLARIPRIRRFLRRARVDLLHCHLPVSAAAGRLAAWGTGVPVISTEHGPLERFKAPSRWLDLATWRLQDAVVAVSPQIEESVRRHAGERVPVRSIVNGVPTDRFDPERVTGDDVRARLEIPPAAPVVGTVAVFRAQKRLDDWLEIARRVYEAEPAARFVLVGDGPLRHELEALAGRLELSGAVSFVGLQDDVRPYLAAMDVFLSTSGYEGLPVALLEAMSLARAPVATAVQGVRSIISEGEDGLLFEPGDVTGMTEAVRRLLSDQDLRGRLGAAARHTVRRRFGMERMMREIEDLYRHVLEARSHDR